MRITDKRVLEAFARAAFPSVHNPATIDVDFVGTIEQFRNNGTYGATISVMQNGVKSPWVCEVKKTKPSQYGELQTTISISAGMSSTTVTYDGDRLAGFHKAFDGRVSYDVVSQERNWEDSYVLVQRNKDRGRISSHDLVKQFAQAYGLEPVHVLRKVEKAVKLQFGISS